MMDLYTCPVDRLDIILCFAAYQGIYVPPGTPSSQSMPLMPQHPEVLIQDMSTTPGEKSLLLCVYKIYA